jgi:hypothetical protein
MFPSHLNRGFHIVCQVRSDGKNADVEASLNDIEEQLKFHIGVAFGRRVSNG